MTDLATRLAAVLDRAEAEARNVAPSFVERLADMVTMSGGNNEVAEFALGWSPAVVLRLIERDRALIADYEAARGVKLAWIKFEVLHAEVERAAAFWSPEVPDAR